MRVLYLDPTVTVGGAEKSLLELVSGIDPELVEPVAACIMEGPLPDALRRAGVEVVINPWPSFALRVGRSSALSKAMLPLAAVALAPHVLRMARLVRRERIRIVHTNGVKSHLVGFVVRLLTGCRLVWHARDVLRPGLTRRLFGLLARLSVSKLIANSRTVAATFPNLPLGRLQVVYNGLDTNLYAPGAPSPEVRASLGLEPGDFVIGAIGALAPLKGHIHIIRAAPRILEAIPNARILIVGREMYVTLGHGGYRGVLEEEIRRLGVQGRVILAGHRDDPVAVLRNLDVLVHASVHPESFGRVLAEAMACGVPVIATALGGPTEILASEEQGILIPAGEPAAIADEVIGLHREPERRKKMGTAGRERVIGAFSVERYVREVEAIYRDLAA